MSSTMVFLPGGRFAMGTPEGDIDRLRGEFGVRRRELFAPEVPRREVTVAPFFLDRYPVTNAEFGAFLAARPEWSPARIAPRHHNGDYLKGWRGGYYPPDRAAHPVVCVPWHAALAYARWAGKRLPTEAEWEFAARGGLIGATFPWGNEPVTPARANYAGSGIGTTTPVGRYPPNGYGLYDLAGNVWEYCLDEWRADFYATGPAVNPVAGGCRFEGDESLAVTTRRVIRGGSWGGSPVNLRVAYRDSHPPDGAGDHVGFRCARSVAGAVHTPDAE